MPDIRDAVNLRLAPQAVKKFSALVRDQDFGTRLTIDGAKIYGLDVRLIE